MPAYLTQITKIIVSTEGTLPEASFLIFDRISVVQLLPVWFPICKPSYNTCDQFPIMQCLFSLSSQQSEAFIHQHFSMWWSTIFVATKQLIPDVIESCALVPIPLALKLLGKRIKVEIFQSFRTF